MEGENVVGFDCFETFPAKDSYLSSYFYGNSDRAVIRNEDYISHLGQYWELYKRGLIDNLFLVSTYVPTDEEKKNGMVSAHDGSTLDTASTYCIKDVNYQWGYVELMNSTTEGDSIKLPIDLLPRESTYLEVIGKTSAECDELYAGLELGSTPEYTHSTT